MGYLNRIERFLSDVYDFLFAIYRDIIGIVFFARMLRRIKQNQKNDLTVAQSFRHLVHKHPNKTCIIIDHNKTWSFRQVDEYSNRVANLFQQRFQLKKGDCVALFMENRPEFVCIWLGLSKVGVITALINTNLKNDSLLHSITVADSKCVIYGNSLEECKIRKGKILSKKKLIDII
jgi:solute carrier family 27 fatty acid transporter 1/4